MHNADLNQAVAELEIKTRGEGMIDFSYQVAKWLSSVGAGDGILTVFIRHTSASLTIQENADPDVQADIVDALGRLAPKDRLYRHATEGPDDMPAHIKSAITSTSLAIPVHHGRMMLGTWQGLFVIEHRTRSHKRNVALHYLGSFPAG